MLSIMLTFALVFGIIVLSPGLASAHSMDGSSWSDEHVLCTTCTVSQGRVVAWWQTVLYSDGFLARCGSTGIDGIFGSFTRTDTMNWQRRYGLTVDGIVGPQTWNKARDLLGSRTGYFYPWSYFLYEGTDHTSKIRRNVDTGLWQFDAPTDGDFWVATDHPSISFPTC